MHQAKRRIPKHLTHKKKRKTQNLKLINYNIKKRKNNK